MEDILQNLNLLIPPKCTYFVSFMKQTNISYSVKTKHFRKFRISRQLISIDFGAQLRLFKVFFLKVLPNNNANLHFLFFFLINLNL